jgi:hypothetical protein
MLGDIEEVVSDITVLQSARCEEDRTISPRAEVGKGALH